MNKWSRKCQYRLLQVSIVYLYRDTKMQLRWYDVTAASCLYSFIIYDPLDLWNVDCCLEQNIWRGELGEVQPGDDPEVAEAEGELAESSIRHRSVSAAVRQRYVQPVLVRQRDAEEEGRRNWPRQESRREELVEGMVHSWNITFRNGAIICSTIEWPIP